MSKRINIIYKHNIYKSCYSEEEWLQLKKNARKVFKKEKYKNLCKRFNDKMKMEKCNNFVKSHKYIKMCKCVLDEENVEIEFIINNNNITPLNNWENNKILFRNNEDENIIIKNEEDDNNKDMFWHYCVDKQCNIVNYIIFNYYNKNEEVSFIEGLKEFEEDEKILNDENWKIKIEKVKCIK